jgi:hypothetical protein
MDIDADSRKRKRVEVPQLGLPTPITAKMVIKHCVDYSFGELYLAACVYNALRIDVPHLLLNEEEVMAVHKLLSSSIMVDPAIVDKFVPSINMLNFPEPHDLVVTYLANQMNIPFREVKAAMYRRLHSLINNMGNALFGQGMVWDVYSALINNWMGWTEPEVVDALRIMLRGK